MNYPILIVSAEVNVRELIMYTPNGETITMKQGDPRIRDLVAKLAPALESGNRQYWLTEEDMSGKNHFAEAEKKTNGLVRFFKVAKTKLKEIAEKFLEPLAPMELGVKPKSNEPVHMVNGEPVEDINDFPTPVVGELPPEEHRPLTKSAEAVAEIMANAVTTSDAKFGEVVEEQTIVAVTSNNTVIPGVEQISNQMQSVSESVGSANGLSKFFDRMAMVQRGHSAEDLLKFMQKGELPVADDGCALVYKRLKSTREEGVYVDVHSGQVKQRVGSFVHMAEHMVDHNRHKDCSNGLHVARRDYLNAFSGDVTVLAKLAPEDVIAVPQYDARKLRAKAYHIIAVLSKEDATLVNSNRPMQDTALLANAVAGNHVGILEYVEITEAKGGGLKVTPAGEVVEAPVADISDRTVHSLDHLNGASEESSSVDARALALDLAKPGTDFTAVTTIQDGQVTDVKQYPAGGYADGDSFRQQAEPSVPVAVPEPKAKLTVLQQLLNDWAEADTDTDRLIAAKSLLTFKKQAKKSWTALGVDIKVWEKVLQIVEKDAAAASLPKVVPPNDDKHFPVLAGNNDGLPAKPAKVKKAAPPRKVPVTKTKDKPATTKPVLESAMGKPKVKPVATPTSKPKRSQKEEAAHLLDIYTKNPDYTNCKQLVAFKKAAKKGWTALGIDESIGKKAEARVKL